MREARTWTTPPHDPPFGSLIAQWPSILQHVLNPRLCLVGGQQFHEMLALQVEKPLFIDTAAGFHVAATHHDRDFLPNQMIVRSNGKPHAIYTRDPNSSFMNDAGKAACRLPSGHPEAFFEAFTVSSAALPVESKLEMR